MAIQTQLYEVLEGKHAEGDKIIKKGERFASEHADLCERFPGRFRKVEAYQVPAPAGGIKIKARVVEGASEAELAADPDAALKAGVRALTTPKEDAALAARGTDVTADFKLPKEAKSVKVFSRGDFFHAYEESSTTPLNPKGLKKDAVVSFVTKWLEE